MYDNMKFVQNNFYVYNDYAICGTRGWIDPSSDKFNSKDAKIYAREQIRIKLSLDSAKKAGFNKFIVMIHYPPFGNENEETEFMKIFKEYKVEKVVYGHLHGPSNVKAIEGDINGVEYIMTSCDFIDFDPIKIWGGEEKLKRQQENDEIKNQYCKNNNINLVRIPYTKNKEEIIQIINDIIRPATTTA